MNKLFKVGALCAALGIGGALFAAPVTHWDFSGGKAAGIWSETRNLTATPGKDGLVLQVTGPDSNLATSKLALPAKEYSIVRVVYRAEGFAKKTTGELFFKGTGAPNYDENKEFYMPPLLCDGREHAIVWDATKNVRDGHKAWLACQTVTGFRLDLVNEFPGTITLKSVDFYKSAADLPADTSLVWNFPDALEHWSKTRALSVTSLSDGALLDITGKDCNIEHRNCAFDAAKYSRVRIVYKAEGLPANTHGQIFYYGKQQSGYHDKSRLNLPSLTSDGNWHTLVIDATTDAEPGGIPWKECGTMTHLRLDIVDEAPGKVTLKSIELLPAKPLPLNGMSDVNLKSGWYLPLDEDGKFAVTLPAGNYKVWLYGADSAANAALALTAVHGFSAQKGGKANGFESVGTLALAKTASVSAAIPGTMGILVTAENATPQVVAPHGPEKIESVVYGKKAHVSVSKFYDPGMPYWNGKMLCVPGEVYSDGDSFFRRNFNLKSTPQSALLQVDADDEINEIWLNGTKLAGVWSKDWKFPSTVDVTKYLKAGRNTLALSYKNNGNVGGLMYDLTVNLAGETVIIAGDGSEKCCFGKVAADWAKPNFDDRPWSAPEINHGPPQEPYDKCFIPYIDFAPPGGTCELVKAEMANNDTLKVTLRATPALKGDEAFFAHIYPANATAETTPLAIQSKPVKECNLKVNSDGTCTLSMGNFPIAQYGGERKLEIRYGIYRRTLNGKTNAQIAWNIPARPLPGAEKQISTSLRRFANATSMVELDGKPFYPTLLDIFYERIPTGLEGADTPMMLRIFTAGGMANEWWIGPDRYDFSEVDSRICKILREYPNAYIGAWVWCQAPLWYNKVYPERISLDSDGRVFPYYVSTVTFSNADYRRDAAKALTALIRHCEENFGNRMFLYNLVGGISYEWQGWGCHSQAQRKVMNDYSKGAERDFLAYLAKNHPEIKATKVPPYEERAAAGKTLFRNAATEAAVIAYDEYYSESVATCIAELAHAAKKAAGVPKLIGAYYGYYFEYANMLYCVNGSGHNAMTTLLQSPDIDFILSPPSYGVRLPGEPGADMKVFGSIQNHGKLSILEDDSRTHMTNPRDHGQTMNVKQTTDVLRRNWGMALSRRTPLCLLPLEEGNDHGDPATRADLHKVLEAGRELYAEAAEDSGTRIAVVVDEHSYKFLRPQAQTMVSTSHRTYRYNHQGHLLQYQRSEQALLGSLIALQRKELSRIGANADWIYVDDVPQVADRYKFFIFLSEFADSPALRAALAALKSKPVTVLSVYGTGFAGTKAGEVNAENMSQLLGMQFKVAAPGSLKLRIDDLANPVTKRLKTFQLGSDGPAQTRFTVTDQTAKVLGHYTEGGDAAVAFKQLGAMKLYFSGSNELSPDFLKELAREAGVFIHSESDDNYFAGYGIHAIHALRSGKKTIRFEKPVTVRDVFTGETLGKNVTEVSFPLGATETRVLKAK